MSDLTCVSCSRSCSLLYRILIFDDQPVFFEWQILTWGGACSKANFLQTGGQKTPIFIRFSTVTLSREFPDSARNPRWFAINFYTAESNYNIVGLNWVFNQRNFDLFPCFHDRRNPLSSVSRKTSSWTMMPSSISWPAFLRAIMPDRCSSVIMAHLMAGSTNTATDAILLTGLTRKVISSTSNTTSSPNMGRSNLPSPRR